MKDHFLHNVTWICDSLVQMRGRGEEWFPNKLIHDSNITNVNDSLESPYDLGYWGVSYIIKENLNKQRFLVLSHK